jgi:hypothetical protein
MEQVDELSDKYIELRKARDTLKKNYDEQDGELERQMQEVENSLLEIMNSINTDTMGTPRAVVMRTVRKRYMPTNWQAVYDLIAKHKAFGLLEKRVHNTNMRDFLEQHPEEYPAGLNVDSRYTVVVRRKASE